MRGELIEYNGEMLTLNAIAVKENVSRQTLTDWYKRTNNIYEAVKLTKSAQAKRNGNILYKGKLMSALSITNLEGIKRDTLKEFYELYDNINKAVFLTKESQKRRRQALYKNNPTSIESFSKYYKISVLKLNELIESGLSLDDIEKQIEKNNKPHREITMYNGQSLYQFCLDHGYNYWVINHIINKYNKTVEEAINEYVLNGQQIPTKWIYEKYNILFKHLMLKFSFDSNRVIKIIKEENCDIAYALIKLIFISDKNLKSVESN